MYIYEKAPLNYNSNLKITLYYYYLFNVDDEALLNLLLKGFSYRRLCPVAPQSWIF